MELRSNKRSAACLIDDNVLQSNNKRSRSTAPFADELGGFLEGDGCIRIATDTRSKTQQVHIHFAQSCDAGIPIILQHIMDRYGGSAYPGKKRNSTASSVRHLRTRWHLQYRRKSQVGKILAAVLPVLQLKRTQAEIAIDCLKPRSKPVKN